ncbi:hypothetical protein LA080_011781 [Diaporthe eres]|nr:hypothetical protein LA080_011781 [Diaporthe eres]
MSWPANLPQAARVPKHAQSHEELISPPANIEERDLSDGEASDHSRGMDDTLRVTQVPEEHGIPNWLVGVSALKFYGAGRVQDPCPYTTPGSLNYTYGRFQSKGKDHYFVLVPSGDAYIVISPINLTRSIRGLPYPKLEVFIQSCLARSEELELEDVIDGSDVSERWGEEFLDLEGTNDINWAERMHQKGFEFAKADRDLERWIFFRTSECSKREVEERC